MYWATRSLAIFFACFIAIASQTARADCTLTEAQVTSSRALKNLSNQINDSRFAASDREDLEFSTFDARHLAAGAGFVLGRQVEHLGDSAERRAMFDCLHEYFSNRVVSIAIEWRGDPLEADRLFQEATLGIIEEDVLVSLGIDPTWVGPSIFDADWTGMWEVLFTAPRAEGAPLKADLSIVFSFEPTGSMNAEVSSEGKVQGRYPAKSIDVTVTFEIPSEWLHHTVTLSQTGENSCEGTMESVDKQGNILTWTASGIRR